MNKIACLTVFYPNMAPFAARFMHAVQAQTQRNFDLVVVLDQYPSISLAPYRDQLGERLVLLDCSQDPLENRMRGLALCLERGYDMVVSADSDEVMGAERIAGACQFFQSHPNALFVYNNARCTDPNAFFDLYYKDVLSLEDILDFNVLGWGALNLSTQGIQFVLEHQNKSVLAFDWWLASVFLLQHRQVHFLKKVYNHYIPHDNHFVGPLLDINPKRVQLGIDVKKRHYRHLSQHCSQLGKSDQQGLFMAKLQAVEATEAYIQNQGLETYLDRVRQVAASRKKLFWWQDAMTLETLGLK